MWRYILSGLAGGLFILAGKLIADHWEKVQKELKGKKLAVLGPRASGKTTLIKFLLKGELAEEYVATGKPEKFSGKTVKLQDLELEIKDTTDVPGDVQSHDVWERLYKDADVAFYLVDTSRLRAGDQGYEKTVLSDMRHIGEWFDEREDNPPRFFLVATHCDLITDYASLPVARRAEFTDALWKMPVMQTLVNFGRGSKNVKCVAGSLKGRDESEKLVGDILRQVIA